MKITLMSKQMNGIQLKINQNKKSLISINSVTTTKNSKTGKMTDLTIKENFLKKNDQIK